VGTSKKKRKLPSTLTGFWHVETLDERAQRNARKFEELNRMDEGLQLANCQSKLSQKAMSRDCGRERQRRWRERKREQKLASGWVPGRKKVSVHM
jgi:hypothetical protein